MKIERTYLFSVLFAISSGGLFADPAVWLSVPEAPVCTNVVHDGSRAADGTSWFAATYRNAAEIRRAKWTMTGLGVFDVYVNGVRVSDENSPWNFALAGASGPVAPPGRWRCAELRPEEVFGRPDVPEAAGGEDLSDGTLRLCQGLSDEIEAEVHGR